MRKLKGYLSVLAGLLFISSSVFADPTRTELYRNDQIQTVVFKDSSSADVFWYLPPMKLYEVGGKVRYERFPKKGMPKKGKLKYTFWVLPYTTDEIRSYLKNEVPGLEARSQLKPVKARRFGIQLKDYGVLNLSDEFTDLQYLNQPMPVSVLINRDQVDEFETLLSNKPGVPAHVILYYDAEKMDAWINIELTYKEVYDALNIKASGKYKFTRAEVEVALTEYLEKKYLKVQSKGDLKVPDIVNKVLQECFTPVKGERLKGVLPVQRDADAFFLERASAEDALFDTESTIKKSFWTSVRPSDSELDAEGESDEDEEEDSDSGTVTTTDVSTKSTEPEVLFQFKKEKSKIDKAFYYRQEKYVDVQEVSAIPVYLSTLPSDKVTGIEVTPLPKHDFVIEHENQKDNVYSTGIMVNKGEQYVIDASFTWFAEINKRYRKKGQPKVTEKRWPKDWGSPDEDLYFRVGSGSWEKVNGRALIKSEALYKGELQFYIDKDALWNKLPYEHWRDPSEYFCRWYVVYCGPPLLYYRTFYPQFNVMVSGHKYELK